MPASRRYPEQSARIGYVLLAVQQQFLLLFHEPCFKNMFVSTTCFLLYGGAVAIEHFCRYFGAEKEGYKYIL